MILSWCSLAVAGLLAAPPAAGGGPTDRDRLQGEWVLVSMDAPGRSPDADAVRRSKLVVTGDAWVVTTAGRAQRLTFKVGAPGPPKEIDHVAAPADGGATWPGIYELDGDTLTVCWPVDAAGGRPAALKAGGGAVLAVYRRAGK